MDGILYCCNGAGSLPTVEGQLIKRLLSIVAEERIGEIYPTQINAPR
jgi:hypothetical protein